MEAPAGKLAEGPKGGVPPWKKGQKIDLTIAHWSLWAPRRSGLYETVRELIAAENRIEGVLAGMCVIPPAELVGKREVNRFIQGGMVDAIHPELRTQDWGWAYKFADIHVIHYTYDKQLGKLKPKVFMAHGTPEAVLEGSMMRGDKAQPLLSGAEWINKFEATIVTSQRAKMFWGTFDSTGKKTHVVNKGIDLEWWQRSGTVRDVPGDPSVLYGEVWRGIKHPALLFYAMAELYRRNEKARLNVWSLSQNIELWTNFIGQAGFWHFMGQENLPGVIEYPEHFYSRGDVLVSPVTAGDLSRVAQESMACGCPVISWDTDPHGENYPYKAAKGFDVMDLADKIEEAYNEVLDDPEGVRKKCRQIAETYFDINDEAKSIVDILRQIVAQQ